MKRWRKWSAKSSGILFVTLNNALRASALLFLFVYRQFISPFVTALFGDVCRFQPTCSQYSRSAFEQHPPCTAAWLSVRRLCKCHPLGPFGYDPVPGRKLS